MFVFWTSFRKILHHGPFFYSCFVIIITNFCCRMIYIYFTYDTETAPLCNSLLINCRHQSTIVCDVVNICKFKLNKKKQLMLSIELAIVESESIVRSGRHWRRKSNPTNVTERSLVKPLVYFMYTHIPTCIRSVFHIFTLSAKILTHTPNLTFD